MQVEFEIVKNPILVAKIDELVEQPLRGEADAIGDLGQGMDAVVAGNKWYHHLMDKYGFAEGRPLFQRVVAQLQARRAADLSAAESAIIAEIENQSSGEGVENVRSSYLNVPGDNKTQTAAAIAKVATARKKAIEREQALARFSPHEREWLIPTGSIAIPSEVPEPDEADLRVAIVRTLEMMGGESVDPFTIQCRTRLPNDSASTRS
jgi:hypothetical protein